jgi:hypothetical protein
MDSSHFPSALRIVQIPWMASASHPGEALDDFDTTKCPDGMLAFVTQSQILYALNKASAITPDGTTIVAAVGGGNWVAQSSGVNSLYSFQVQSVASGIPTTGAVTQNTWHAMPSSTSQYTSVGSGLFSANTTTGIVTYAGPTRSFLLLGNLSASNGVGLADIDFSYSHSAAAILGGTSTPNTAMIAELSAANTDIVNIAFTAFIVTLVAAQTVQGAVRNKSGTTAISVYRYTLTFLPLG